MARRFVLALVLGLVGQLERYFAKNGAEWGAGNITKEAYLKRAAALLSPQPGGRILGATRTNGDILRYNLRTNEFAVGTPQGSYGHSSGQRTASNTGYCRCPDGYRKASLPVLRLPHSQ